MLFRNEIVKDSLACAVMAFEIFNMCKYNIQLIVVTDYN